MRLLHVYSGNLFGGIETMLLACGRGASTVPGLQHEYALCFDDRLASELRRLECPVHLLGPVRIRRPSTVLAARMALDAVLSSGRFDCVICHAPWTHAIFGAVSRRHGVPLVFWAHDVMTGLHWTERYARFVVPDLVVCNSAFTAGTLDHLYPRTRAVVVHPPVWAAAVSTESDRSAPEAQRRRAELRREIRASLDTAASAFVIVQASRCDASKGHTMLLDALAELADEPHWVWWVVGGAQRPAEEGFMAALKASAERAGLSKRIRWIGQRSDVVRLFGAADVHCQANLKPEAFGVAFVEALAAGLPVVTVALGGACEIVDDTCGVLTPPNDRHALAGALRRLMHDQTSRAQLADGGPARARRLCHPAAQLRALHAALHSMTPVEASA